MYELKEVMRLIDHSGLKPYLTENDIFKLADEAHLMGNYSICIEPIYGRPALEYIKRKGYGLKIDVTLDFPFGSLDSDSRIDLVRRSAYADEIDIVMQIGYAKTGKWDKIREDLDHIVAEAHRNGQVIKIITEDAYLTSHEKERAYRAVVESGPDFIKTSTGFADAGYAEKLGNAAGATPENVALMSRIASELGSEIGIKAAGGIHTIQQVEAIIKASGRPLDPRKLRLGLSGTVKLYEEMAGTPLRKT